MGKTKTEEKLLALLKASHHGSYTVLAYHGHGPEGGIVKGGSRMFGAARSLIDQGLVAQHGDIARSHRTKNGYTVFGSELTVRLP
jgi:hypothetical protein